MTEPRPPRDHAHLYTVMDESEVKYYQWGEHVEDDITRLPKGWEARVAADSRVYFLE